MGFIANTSIGTVSNSSLNYPFIKEWQGIVKEKSLIIPAHKIPREINLYSDKLINIYWGDQAIPFYAINNQIFVDNATASSLSIEPAEGDTNIKILLRSVKAINYTIGVGATVPTTMELDWYEFDYGYDTKIKPISIPVKPVYIIFDQDFLYATDPDTGELVFDDYLSDKDLFVLPISQENGYEYENAISLGKIGTIPLLWQGFSLEKSYSFFYDNGSESQTLQVYDDGSSISQDSQKWIIKLYL